MEFARPENVKKDMIFGTKISFSANYYYRNSLFSRWFLNFSTFEKVGLAIIVRLCKYCTKKNKIKNKKENVIDFDTMRHNSIQTFESTSHEFFMPKGNHFSKMDVSKSLLLLRNAIWVSVARVNDDHKHQRKKIYQKKVIIIVFDPLRRRLRMALCEFLFMLCRK